MDGNLAYIAAVAGIGSAIGGLIGTLATMWVARKQIQATVTTTEQQMHTAVTLAEKDIHARVVLAERMKWIATLRESIAEFHGVLFAMSSRIQLQGANTLFDKDMAKMDSEAALYAKICLLLNPNEKDHLAFIDLMSVAMNEANNAFKNDPAVLGRLLNSAKKILKREWEVVKKGK